MSLSLDLRKKVNGFSLDIAWEMRDELTVLFGCSGSGKSLTLQMIAGLMKPDSGQINFKGQHSSTARPASTYLPSNARSGMSFSIWPYFPT
jgi:molybdate transport system ATP-binding protein